MCGILGSTKNKIEIAGALQSLAHRGPDQRGTFTDGEVAFGHCRLSIIDLSDLGKQPLTDRSGNLTITYNGEIYNYQELKEELRKTGAQFKTATDTEVILEGYAKESVSFFEKLRGMWALALYDRRKGFIILSRDRFGIKPLYYTVQGGNLSFASELKAFKQLGITLKPNTHEYSTFFALGYFAAPATCYEDIFMLEPGEILTYDLASKKVHSSSLPEVRERVKDRSEKEILDSLHHTLLQSVRTHFVADVPVGLLFSGGNDSTLIAALSREAGFNPQAYHLAVEGSSDTSYARRIAEKLELKCECIPMSARELELQYESVWDTLDTPSGDVSIIPTSLIYKKIAGRSKVVLSGEGGDEWFGGYPRHNRLAALGGILGESREPKALESLYGTSAFALQWLNPLLRRARDLALGNDVIGTYLMHAGIIDYPLAPKLRAKLYEMYGAHKGVVPPNLFFDAMLYLPNDLLIKNDLASMASSIEARVPLVDIEVLKNAQTIPPHMRLSPMYKGKYLLKKLLERYLPHDLVHRDKRGFGFSFERYHVPQFHADVEKALAFHREHAGEFGLAEHRALLNDAHAEIFIKKFPRFAFALVSNWKVFKN